ncbi:reverse transcriptase [Phytophthora megakarya]|uniref:Reverse transcriptase n=1 Tax=Phytophthora megakarya TaxID=4795 RepID=A0A225W122_9STRA|nr:reverse transcriptase [Phytophthora megakarya]
MAAISSTGTRNTNLGGGNVEGKTNPALIIAKRSSYFLFQKSCMLEDLNRIPGSGWIISPAQEREIRTWVVDYIFTRGNDIQSHLDVLDTVLTRLEENHFYVKLSKCVFCSAEIPCLGDYIGRNGIRIDLKKVVVLREWSLPKTKNELQSFLGTATYVQRFFAGFANDAGPLFDMIKKDKLKNNKNIGWSEDQKQHFESLKQRISATPILAVADFSKPFYMRMDATRKT